MKNLPNCTQAKSSGANQGQKTRMGWDGIRWKGMGRARLFQLEGTYKDHLVPLPMICLLEEHQKQIRE